MSRRENKLLISDMLQAAANISRYTEGLSFEQFIDDQMTKDAVVRNFEIIGEAATRVSDDFQDIHPEIEWKRIRGFRNRIVHECFGVDYEIVWEIIQSYLPELSDFLEQLRSDTSSE